MPFNISPHYKTKLKKSIKLFLRELLAYLYYFLKPSSESVKIVIFAQGRTGSTLLEDLLCSTYHFRKNGELLGAGNREVWFPYFFISGLSKRFSNENFIFHLKIYHLTRDRKNKIDPSSFLKSLHQDGWKIIYLKRKNKAKHVFSNILAGYRGEFHKYDDESENIRIKIDLDSFEDSLENRMRFDNEEIDALKNLNFLSITYEDDLENSDCHQQTINSILDFVSLEHRPVSTALKKISAKNLKEQVVNYDALYNLLKKRNWLDFLN